MSKQYKIRWRESDTQQLKRTVKNFNAKINRILKKNPEAISYLPQKITIKEAREMIETRADLNRLTHSLQRFSKRGAEKAVSSSRGAKATEWEVKEFNRKQATVNRKRKKELDKITAQEVKIGGKTTGQTRARMGSIKENDLHQMKKNFKNMTQKEWDLAMRSIDAQLNTTEQRKKRETMRENYIKGLREGGFLDEHPELETYIRGVDLDTFYETVQTDETATFTFYKDPIEWQTRLDYIEATWQRAYEKW